MYNVTNLLHILFVVNDGLTRWPNSVGWPQRWCTEDNESEDWGRIGRPECVRYEIILGVYIKLNTVRYRQNLATSATTMQLFYVADYVNFFSEIFRLLDDLGHEVDMTDSRLQQTLQKIEKVLRLSDGNVWFTLYACFFKTLTVEKMLTPLSETLQNYLKTLIL